MTEHPGGTAKLAGHTVARIGYGAMQLSLEHSRPAVERTTAIDVLRRAVELGVDHIDTAAFYGDRLANDLIREALAPYPDELVLVSKLGARHDSSAERGLAPAQRPTELRAELERNLRSLGVDRLPVVNLRRLDAGAGLRANGDQVVDLDDQLAELVALRDEGKIGAIGLSSVAVDQIRQALPVGIACVQNVYSLVDRTNEDELALCREHDIAWVPFFPLGSAFGGPKVVNQPAVQQAAAELGATPAQIGLAWLLAHAPNTLLIPGTGSVAHLTENVGAGDVHLDVATMSRLAETP